MKTSLTILLLGFLYAGNSYAQCETDKTLTGSNNMPALTQVSQNITVNTSSVKGIQTVALKAGNQIDLSDFDVNTDATDNAVFNADLDPGTKYKIGAWYHSNWYLDAFLADRNKGYYADALHAGYGLNALPNNLRIADIWDGVRNVAHNDKFYADIIPEMSDLSYRLAHKPLLGFYDIADQRVIDKHIEMASSRGLYYFGFYNAYQEDGTEAYTNKIVERFKSSTKNHLMKYLVSLYNPNSITSDVNTFIANIATTVVAQLASNTDANKLHPSYLTNDNGQPIVCIATGFFFAGMTEANVNSVATTIKGKIKLQFGINPIILLVSDRGSTRAKNLITNNNYDGYIGFQHLMPTSGIYSGDDYNDDSKNIELINTDLIATIPNSVPKKYNIPSISAGFDSRPWIPIPYFNADYAKEYFKNNTPSAFEKYLIRYKKFIDMHPEANNMLMCYAWNEWGESGILEPSVEYQYQYLDKIKSVFGFSACTTSTVNPDITGFSTTYDAWKLAYTWGSYLSDYNDDSDGDGFTNIFEYAFDLNPLVSNSSDLISYYNSSSPHEIKYKRDYKKSDLIYFVENSQYNSLTETLNDQYAYPANTAENEWSLYDDTNWGYETNTNWANIVSVNGTIETRTCRPKTKPRTTWQGQYDEKVKRLRLVLGVMQQDRPIETPIQRFFFPNSHSSGIRVGDSNTDENAGISVYPNPTTHLVNVSVNKLKQGDAVDITIYNAEGIVVNNISKKDEANFAIDLSVFSQGIYMVRVVSGDLVKVTKLIVN